MSQATEASAGQGKPEAQTVHVLVYTARDPGDKRPFSWSKHLSVGEAAADAAAEFGVSGGNPTLAKDGKPLDRSKQLVAEHVKDGDVLELVDVGGGV
jgi:hypothetical protein